MNRERRILTWSLCAATVLTVTAAEATNYGYFNQWGHPSNPVSYSADNLTPPAYPVGGNAVRALGLAGVYGVHYFDRYSVFYSGTPFDKTFVVTGACSWYFSIACDDLSTD